LNGAQKKVEENNFAPVKIAEGDDVTNKQRNATYGKRNSMSSWGKGQCLILIISFIPEEGLIAAFEEANDHEGFKLVSI
jgi:hypothetical protein